MAAYMSKPNVANIKMNTTISSFVESRSIIKSVPKSFHAYSAIASQDSRKHKVDIFSSFASLQIGKLYPEQKALLQSAQVPCPILGSLELPPPGLEAGLPSSGIMVLFEKHVHLQKDVPAIAVSEKETLGSKDYM
jgi:hypothetical protein